MNWFDIRVTCSTLCVCQSVLVNSIVVVVVVVFLQYMYNIGCCWFIVCAKYSESKLRRKKKYAWNVFMRIWSFAIERIYVFRVYVHGSGCFSLTHSLWHFFPSLHLLSHIENLPISISSAKSEPEKIDSYCVWARHIWAHCDRIRFLAIVCSVSISTGLCVCIMCSRCAV